jgi:2-desacetyl-2-hydroxyethyl bacteriochlorophyllide A dehydrogenase
MLSIHMANRIVFPAQNEVKVESFDAPAPGPGQVRLKSICSLMSNGTENIVLRRLFEPGTHWAGWVKYPFYPGYAMIAQVEKVGPDVSGLKVGDRVAGRIGHASQNTVNATQCHRVPSGIESEQASWFALAKITLHGALAADYELADRVLVIGAGPIGQMSIRWAKASGATRIVCIDKEAARLELAKRGGATATFALPPESALDSITAACGGERPRVVIDTTGNAAVFTEALKLAANRGTVLLMGDTGTPSAQHLTVDVVTRGLTVIGAHDTCYPPGWNEAKMYETFFNFVATGRFDLAGLITHRFTSARAAEAYETSNQRRGETMGILFDWKE